MRIVRSLMVLGLLVPGAAQAADPVSMWFEGAELVDVVRRAAEATGRSLLLDEPGPMAGKKVTLLVARPVPPGEAWELALGALEANGLTASCHGAFVRVIEARAAQGSPGCR